MQHVIDRINRECANRDSNYFQPWTIGNIHTRTLCKSDTKTCFETDFCEKCIRNCKFAGKIATSGDTILVLNSISDLVRNEVFEIKTMLSDQNTKYIEDMRKLQDENTKLVKLCEKLNKDINSLQGVVVSLCKRLDNTDSSDE